MTDFTLKEIRALRAMLMPPATRMREIVHAFSAYHTRDEVVEATDACRRHWTDQAALTHVNAILIAQERGEPLINGRLSRRVLAKARGAFMPAPGIRIWSGAPLR